MSTDSVLDFLDDRSLAGRRSSTIARYGEVLDRLAADLCKDPLKVTHNELRRYVMAWQEAHTANGAAFVLRHLRAFYKWAVAEQYLGFRGREQREDAHPVSWFVLGGILGQVDRGQTTKVLEADQRDEPIPQSHCAIDPRGRGPGDSEKLTQGIETGLGRADGPRVMEVASVNKLLNPAADGGF